MIDISAWTDKFLQVLTQNFRERIWFVGLQGSYARGEATETSDIDTAAVNRAIKIGACNIYHGCVHNMLYEKSEEILRGLYKSASFVVQAICFKQTGKYVCQQKKLLQIVEPDEQVIVHTFLELKSGGLTNFQKMSETLFEWSKKWIKE